MPLTNCLHCKVELNQTNKYYDRNLCESCASKRTTQQALDKKNKLLCSICINVKRCANYCNACKENTSRICPDCGHKKTSNLFKSITHTKCRKCSEK